MSASQDPKDWMQDPATLSEEIDATREDVGETLDALQEKLSPSQLLDQSVSYLGQRGYELACSLRDAARAHPVPFALAAAGALWVMSRRSEDDVEIELDDELEPAESFEEFAAYGAPGGAGESVESAARRTAQRARSAADTAKARATNAKRAVGRKARRTSDEFSRLLREQPLLVGAIGLAIGATVAALVPVTESEERVLGQKSEHLVRQAKQKASEQADKVRDKARRAAEAARSAMAEPDQVSGSSSGGNGSTTAQSGPGGSSAMPS